MITTWRSTLTERICHNIRICNDGCWWWMGALDAYGYGTLGGKFERAKKTLKAHRTTYELFVGPIPKRLPLDHTCSNHRCVNPEHLEPVTQAENNRRAGQRRTVCKNGHPWSNMLIVRRKTDKVERWCKLCNANRGKRRKLRKGGAYGG